MNAKNLRLVAAAMVACLLGACGGSGGAGGAGAPPPPSTAWQVPQFLEQTNAEARGVDVAINADGTGYSLWQQREGANFVVYASRYRDGLWAPAQRVSDVDADGDAFDVEVVVLPDGEALAAWQQVSAGKLSVAFKRTVNGVWPTDGDALESDLDELNALEMVADGKGNAALVWSQTKGASTEIRGAVFYEIDFGVSNPISTDTTQNAHSPDVAIDAEGRVLVVWVQLNATSGVETVRASAYTGGDWQPEVELNPDETQGSSSPQVAVGVHGAALAVWVRGDGESIQGRRATQFAQGIWSTPLVLDSAGPGRMFSPQVALDAQGHTTVVWLQEDGLPGDSILSLRSGRGADTLTDFQVVETNDAASAQLPEIGIDATGRVVAVWEQRQGVPMDMLANRLDPVTGQWGTPEPIESDNLRSASTASLAVNAAGQVVVAWEQANGDVMANAFK